MSYAIVAREELSRDKRRMIRLDIFMGPVTWQILDQGATPAPWRSCAARTAAREDLSARYISVSTIRARRDVEDAFAT